MTAEWAQKFAAEWIAAWNTHDLHRVLAHYAPNVEFFSPLVQRLLGDTGGKIHGKDALREYFEKALTAYPDLRFDLHTVYAGVNSVTISYRSVKNLQAAEVMLLDNDNRVATVYAHYAE